jgi:hypothetical protein
MTVSLSQSIKLTVRYLVSLLKQLTFNGLSSSARAPATTMATAPELSERLASAYVDEVYADLQNILKAFAKGIRDKMIEMPGTSQAG